MKSEGLKDWQSFSVEEVGKESGFSNNIVFIRFLGLVGTLREKVLPR